jgi:MFS family permease
VIAASILLGAVIGALTCSYLSEKRGRKGTLVMLAVVFVVGAVWCAISPNPVLLRWADSSSALPSAARRRPLSCTSPN